MALAAVAALLHKWAFVACAPVAQAPSAIPASGYYSDTAAPQARECGRRERYYACIQELVRLTVDPAVILGRACPYGRALNEVAAGRMPSVAGSQRAPGTLKALKLLGVLCVFGLVTFAWAALWSGAVGLAWARWITQGLKIAMIALLAFAFRPAFMRDDKHRVPKKVLALRAWADLLLAAGLLWLGVIAAPDA